MRMLPEMWMRIEDIITNAKIYALTLYRLSEEKWIENPFSIYYIEYTQIE